MRVYSSFVSLPVLSSHSNRFPRDYRSKVNVNGIDAFRTIPSVAHPRFSGFEADLKLIQTVREGDLNAFKKAREEGGDINYWDSTNAITSDGFGEAPGMALHKAVQKGYLPIVKYLIEEIKQDPNVTDKSFYWFASPLFYAVCNNHTEIARYLLANGAKADMASHDVPAYNDSSTKAENSEFGGWFLHMALRHKNPDLVRLLVVEGGLDPFFRFENEKHKREKKQGQPGNLTPYELLYSSGMTSLHSKMKKDLEKALLANMALSLEKTISLVNEEKKKFNQEIKKKHEAIINPLIKSLAKSLEDWAEKLSANWWEWIAKQSKQNGNPGFLQYWIKKRLFDRHLPAFESNTAQIMKQQVLQKAASKNNGKNSTAYDTLLKKLKESEKSLKNIISRKTLRKLGKSERIKQSEQRKRERQKILEVIKEVKQEIGEGRVRRKQIASEEEKAASQKKEAVLKAKKEAAIELEMLSNLP